MLNDQKIMQEIELSIFNKYLDEVYNLGELLGKIGNGIPEDENGNPIQYTHEEHKRLEIRFANELKFLWENRPKHSNSEIVKRFDEVLESGGSYTRFEPPVKVINDEVQELLQRIKKQEALIEIRTLVIRAQEESTHRTNGTLEDALKLLENLIA